MVPDLAFAKETFHTFNTLIFSSTLPEPRFTMTMARSFRGKLVYKLIRKYGKKTPFDFELRLSKSFDLEKSVWEDVVIHEMIHLYIALKGIKDRSSHGPAFRQMMHDINNTHGRSITVTARSDSEERTAVNADKRVKAHYVCIAKFSDGRFGIAPVAKTRIFKLWNLGKLFPEVTSIKWIGTTDSFFNTFPHIRTPKLYRVDPENLKSHLKGAQPLEKTGDVIRVVNRRCSPDELLP